MTATEAREGFLYEETDIPPEETISDYKRRKAQARENSRDWSKGKATSRVVRWAESVESIRADLRAGGLL